MAGRRLSASEGERQIVLFAGPAAQAMALPKLARTWC
jgi:hypothetical protein